ncbi:hypothetical protein AX15_003236 [Amanita polypyramis BW_CC]|nr:hypothetical protein AX15_003236 [Amanita polypyramis BW_CC]
MLNLQSRGVRGTYNRIPNNESRDELEGDSILEEAPSRWQKRQGPPRCICCGMSIGTFCKIVGTVSAIFVAWMLVKLALWAFKASLSTEIAYSTAPNLCQQDAPTGLESMPKFSTSLGCLAAPHIYKNHTMTVSIPFDKISANHVFDVYGDIVGTIVVAEGAPQDTEVKYEMTIRANDPALLDGLSFHDAEVASDGTVRNSQFVIFSPSITTPDASCMRYDIKLFVPPSLKKLHVAAHAVTHLKMDPKSNIQLDRFHATLVAMDTNNLVVPHQSLHADTLGLEVSRGWIVGEVSIANTTSITTQRGDGIANIRVHPLPPANSDMPEKAALWTVTGSGRSDFSWVADRNARKRPIEADHKSSQNGDVYLYYGDADFKGLISLDSGSFIARNIHKIRDGLDEGDIWSHWAGDQTGSDRVMIQSRGWTGLYF